MAVETPHVGGCRVRRAECSYRGPTRVAFNEPEELSITEASQTIDAMKTQASGAGR